MLPALFVVMLAGRLWARDYFDLMEQMAVQQTNKKLAQTRQAGGWQRQDLNAGCWLPGRLSETCVMVC